MLREKALPFIQYGLRSPGLKHAAASQSELK